ncbi:hypothetical protein [Acholeplasma granularum]|uniref:hypothetical protein n=1 Tax=Acholeplasma granularum TaxID=264635 RepID=UPI000472009F|nr:hypothetical protein [Acholeplasma granularum]
MKSLRRIIILIIFLLVSVATMATGVFAWFIDYGTSTKVDSFTSDVMNGNQILEIGGTEDIFLGDRVKDLIYLKNSDFSITGYDFYGFSSMIQVEVKNPSLDPLNIANARLQLTTVAAPQFGIYDGFGGNLIYIVLDIHDTMSQSDYLASKISDFQSTGNVFNAISAHNNKTYAINGGDTKTFNVYIWGSYDSLSPAQKNIFHALVYRVKILV